MLDRVKVLDDADEARAKERDRILEASNDPLTIAVMHLANLLSHYSHTADGVPLIQLLDNINESLSRIANKLDPED